MRISYKMFLLAAKEMSFTKAAAKAYVTQQCLSGHIKRLEDLYGLRLFARTPRLKLTQAGESMRKYLRQIQMIEKGMEDELHDMKAGVQGTLALGINATRARILLPDLFAAYHRKFPNVLLSVVLDDVKQLIPLLVEGKIDLFLGVNCPNHELLHKISLKEEPVYLLATERLLRSCGAFALRDDPGGRAEVNLNDFSGVPFVGNNSESTFHQLIHQYANDRDIRLNMIFKVSDYDTQISLCRRHLGAAFCPEIVLEKVVEYNRLCREEERMMVFRINDLNSYLNIDLVEHVNVCRPPYVEAFSELLKKQYRERALNLAPYVNSLQPE